MACTTAANPPHVAVIGYMTLICFNLFAMECRWQWRLGVPVIDASHIQTSRFQVPGFTVSPYFGIAAHDGHTHSAQLKLAA